MTPLAGALFFAGAAIALAALIHAPDIYARWVERKAQERVVVGFDGSRSGDLVVAVVGARKGEEPSHFFIPAADAPDIEPPEKRELLFHVPPGMEWLWETGDLLQEAERQRDRAEPPVASFNFKRGARVSVEPGTEHLWAELGPLGRDYMGGEVR